MAASTLAEVARLAGVSLATASRVLKRICQDAPARASQSGSGQATDSLGYVPNAQAQGLARSSSGLIGLIVHDIADPYFASMPAVSRRRRGTGTRWSCWPPPTEHRTMSAPPSLPSRPAGQTSIVIAGSRSTRAQDGAANAALAAELDRYCRNGGQVSTVGNTPSSEQHPPEGYHVVAVPNEELAAELARELAAGHHPDGFTIIGGPEGLLTSDDRIRGFQRGLAAAGVPEAEVLRTGFDRAGGYEAG